MKQSHYAYLVTLWFLGVTVIFYEALGWGGAGAFVFGWVTAIAADIGREKWFT